MILDPVQTNPDNSSVVFENERVRVPEYLDGPGARTTAHDHPDSVMVTLTSRSHPLPGAALGPI